MLDVSPRKIAHQIFQMPKIILSGYISVPDSEIDGIRNAIQAHIQATRSEPGCMVFSIKEHSEIIGRFDVYEEFKDRNAFDLHQKRVNESSWGKLSKNVSRHYQINEELD